MLDTVQVKMLLKAKTAQTQELEKMEETLHRSSPEESITDKGACGKGALHEK